MKRLVIKKEMVRLNQPPSGGCVLKQVVVVLLAVALQPAAFGRLRVETVRERVSSV